MSKLNSKVIFNPLLDNEQLQIIEPNFLLIDSDVKINLYKKMLSNLDNTDKKEMVGNDFIREYTKYRNKGENSLNLSIILDIIHSDKMYMEYIYLSFKIENKTQSPLRTNLLFLNTHLEPYKEEIKDALFLLRKNIYLLYLLENDNNPMIIYNDVLNHLDSNTCQSLCNDVLAILIEIIIENKDILQYFYNEYYYCDSFGRHHYYFKNLYDKIIVEKKRNFIKMNWANDFALSWLMYLYH